MQIKGLKEWYQLCSISVFKLSHQNEIVQILALSRSNDNLIEYLGNIIDGKWQKNKPPAVFRRSTPDSLVHLDQKAEARHFS